MVGEVGVVLVAAVAVVSPVGVVAFPEAEELDRVPLERREPEAPALVA